MSKDSMPYYETINIFEGSSSYKLLEFIAHLSELEKQGYNEINFDGMDLTVKKN